MRLIGTKLIKFKKRMLDMGFEEDIRKILAFMKNKDR
jgi:hypothetical protein